MVDAVDSVHIAGGDRVNGRQVWRMAAVGKAFAHGPQQRVRAEQPTGRVDSNRCPVRNARRGFGEGHKTGVWHRFVSPLRETRTRACKRKGMHASVA